MAIFVSSGTVLTVFATPCQNTIRTERHAQCRRLELQRRPEAREYLNEALAYVGEGVIHHAGLIPEAIVSACSQNERRGLPKCYGILPQNRKIQSQTPEDPLSPHLSIAPSGLVLAPF